MLHVFDPQILAWLGFAVVGFVMFTRTYGGGAHGCPKHLHGTQRNRGYTTTIDTPVTVLNRAGRMTAGPLRLACGAGALGIVGGILWYWFVCLPQGFPG